MNPTLKSKKAVANSTSMITTLKAILQRKVVVLCQQREPQDNQVEVLTVKRIAYSVDVQLTWTRYTLTDKFVETILEVYKSRSDNWGLTVKEKAWTMLLQ